VIVDIGIVYFSSFVLLSYFITDACHAIFSDEVQEEGFFSGVGGVPRCARGEDSIAIAGAAVPGSAEGGDVIIQQVCGKTDKILFFTGIQLAGFTGTAFPEYQVFNRVIAAKGLRKVGHVCRGQRVAARQQGVHLVIVGRPGVGIGIIVIVFHGS